MISARRRKTQSGFALLLVFVLAGAAAIILYMEMPRAVFEAARTKEDILVERGDQFKLALKRYFKKRSKLPQKMEDLEQTNGVRFLRRKYKDPMTGEDEWRLIHVDAAGQYIDSKVFKPQQADQKESRFSSISGGYQVGGGDLPASGEKGVQDAALRQRASDGNRNPSGTDPAPGADGAPPPPPEGDPGTTPGVPQQGAPQQGSPQQGVPPGQFPGQLPGQLPGQQFPGAIPGMGPGQVLPGQVPGQVPGQFPGMPQGTANSQTGGVVPTTSIPGLSSIGAQPPSAGFPAQPGYPNIQQQQQQGFPQLGGQQPGAIQPGQNQALDMIRNILTTPRQGATVGTPATAGVAMQGGIAGVASKGKGEGIKRINERSKIDEWEFLFDVKTAMQQGAGRGQGAMGGGQGQQGGQQGGRPGQPGGGGGGQGGNRQGGFGSGDPGRGGGRGDGGRNGPPGGFGGQGRGSRNP